MTLPDSFYDEGTHPVQWRCTRERGHLGCGAEARSHQRGTSERVPAPSARRGGRANAHKEGALEAATRVGRWHGPGRPRELSPARPRTARRPRSCRCEAQAISGGREVAQTRVAGLCQNMASPCPTSAPPQPGRRARALLAGEGTLLPLMPACHSPKKRLKATTTSGATSAARTPWDPRAARSDTACQSSADPSQRPTPRSDTCTGLKVVA